MAQRMVVAPGGSCSGVLQFEQSTNKGIFGCQLTNKKKKKKKKKEEESTGKKVGNNNNATTCKRF